MHNKQSQPNFFAAFFGFKRMVSPFFIGLIYFLGLIAIIIGTGLALWQGPQAVGAFQMMDLQGSMIIAAYVGIVLLGLLTVLMWRFYCELLIVLFGIFNRLDDIKSLLKEPVMAAVSASRVQSTIAPVPPAAIPAASDYNEDQGLDSTLTTDSVDGTNVEETTAQTETTEPTATDLAADTQEVLTPASDATIGNADENKETQSDVISLPDESLDQQDHTTAETIATETASEIPETVETTESNIDTTTPPKDD